MSRPWRRHVQRCQKGSVSFMEAATEALKAMQRAHAGDPRERFGFVWGRTERNGNMIHAMWCPLDS